MKGKERGEWDILMLLCNITYRKSNGTNSMEFKQWSKFYAILEKNMTQKYYIPR